VKAGVCWDCSEGASTPQSILAGLLKVKPRWRDIGHADLQDTSRLSKEVADSAGLGTKAGTRRRSNADEKSIRSQLGEVIRSALKQERSSSRPPRLMFVRLIRSRRLIAGWIAAAIYLLCVVAPPVALALGSGPAPCLAEDMLPAVMHTDSHAHDHGSMHAHHHLADEGAPSGHHHDGKGLPGPCCVVLCAVGIATNLPTVAAPLQPTTLRLAEAERVMTGRTPPLLYRPPIA
jgi:hypothetical protein